MDRNSCEKKLRENVSPDEWSTAEAKVQISMTKASNIVDYL
jgi:hypothetical protein